MQKISIPLPLTGAKNVRDLGGYRTEDGKVTKSHSLLRADALNNLTEEDCRMLYEYGVRCIIDLRSLEESEREPDKLPGIYKDIEYLHVPIQDHVRASRYSEEFPPSMWQLYRWLLDDSKESFSRIFKTIGKYNDSCVLFHCSGGKDRTGTIAMLLLKLAGVEDGTVIADYAATQEYMKEIFPCQVADLTARGLVVPHYVMESPPENMRLTLEYLYENYQSAGKYFKSIGLSDEEIEKLKKKLIE
ncbi:protein-tyrosine phosphatase [Anaerocolumna jejuensis DSM 15929]|uniref:Protein-tyrosine phosphatase n=1 Tax=Anaerocolumna jejuensis DSM 15929 TaxID=1121322 RepID=A0A1M6M8G3_9FIRM|nr:tyrosine-protein phosphatase [Anaerocolumna jejuensis]SHJ79704.1 protein-tyrosine phosphatase [Anaerocolumna jejuensis DSM 15929]